MLNSFVFAIMFYKLHRTGKTMFYTIVLSLFNLICSMLCCIQNKTLMMPHELLKGINIV